MENSNVRKPKGFWPMIVVLFSAYFFVNFQRYAGGVSAPYLIKELNLDPTQVGLYSALFTYVYAFANFPAGILTDKFGARKLMSALYLVAAVGTLIIAFSSNFTLIIIGRILIAAGIAPVYNAASKGISTFTTPKEFGVFNGWNQSIGRTGGVLAATPLAVLFVAIGWRNSYILLAAVSVVIAIAAWLLVLETKEEKQSEKGGIGEKSVKLAPTKALLRVIKNPSYWLTIIFMTSLNATSVNIFANWGGVLFQNGLGWDSVTSSKILLTGSIFACFGAVISGYVSKYASGRVSAMIGQTGLLIGTAILAFGLENLTPTMAYIACILIGFVEMWVIAAGIAIMIKLVSTSTTNYFSTCYGLANLCIWLVGSSLLAQIWGALVSDDYILSSFKMPLLLHVGFVAIGLVSIFFIKEKPTASLEEN